MGVPRLELRGIRKAYPTVVANDGVDLAVAPGEIHAVLGENGAGKSTLMKIIYGAVRPDDGRDPLGRRAGRAIATRREARALGIGMVFQHFALFDTLTVGREHLARRSTSARRMAAADGSASATVAAALRPAARPGCGRSHTLSVGERQRVEIVRALLHATRSC